ncbi:MAG: prepilin-type N-terminal cleavage/methylation domain-containing protein [Candidatus Puniceispirillaceae bacterium]
MKSGFSLIELLVVVVIIGVLAGVGLVGYQAYIESTRQEVTDDIAAGVNRTFTQDLVALQNNLSARSALTSIEGNSDTSLLECRTIVNNMVKEVGGPNKASAKKLNPFNANKGFACLGAELASYSKDTLSPATVSTSSGDLKTFGYVTIPRGNMIVFCDGLDTIETHVRSPDATGFALRTCTCLEDDSEDNTLCRTTNRLQGKIFSPEQGGISALGVATNYKRYRETNDIQIQLEGPDDTLNVVSYAANTEKKLYVNGIGNIIVSFGGTYTGLSGGDNITVTIVDGGLTSAGITEFAVDNDTSVQVYMNDNKDCYTPQIDTNANLTAGLDSDYHYCRRQ